MKTVVVTGANGYIGAHVVQELIKYPEMFRVVATSRSCEHIPVGVKFVHLDITADAHRADIYDCLGQPNVCVHLAWRDGFNHNSASHMDDLSSHFEVLQHLANSGTKQFVVAGSFREYGSVNGMVDQSAVVVPDNLYTLSKATLKRALEIYFSDKDVCLQWIRPFTVYGDDQRNNSIMSKIISWEKEGRESFPFTDGNEEYDYISVYELAKQIVAIAAQTEVDGVIDCCSGKPTRLGTKIEEFIRENGYHIKPQYGAFPRREYDSPVIYGDDRKIRTILQNCTFLR